MLIIEVCYIYELRYLAVYGVVKIWYFVRRFKSGSKECCVRVKKGKIKIKYGKIFESWVCIWLIIWDIGFFEGNNILYRYK